MGTVIQVVRNHFDCQVLTGARLNHYDNSVSCFGSFWDERYFFGEDWTPSDIHVEGFFRFSSLTLALLEDSSWYKANFKNARTNSFGHGAGCGFILDTCL